MSETDLRALKIHGYVFDTSSISDGGKSDFDEEYYALKPPPMQIDDIQQRVIKIYPKNSTSLEDLHNLPAAKLETFAGTSSKRSTARNSKHKSRAKSLPRQETDAAVKNGGKGEKTYRSKKNRQNQQTHSKRSEYTNTTIQVKPISDTRNLSTFTVSSSKAKENVPRNVVCYPNSFSSSANRGVFSERENRKFSDDFVPLSSEVLHRRISSENKMLPTTTNAASKINIGANSDTIRNNVDSDSNVPNINIIKKQSNAGVAPINHSQNYSAITSMRSNLQNNEINIHTPYPTTINSTNVNNTNDSSTVMFATEPKSSFLDFIQSFFCCC